MPGTENPSPLFLPDKEEVQQIKKVVTTSKAEAQKQKINLIDQSMSAEVLRSIIHAREQGASSWLNALPLEKHGFVLNKLEFRDTIALRYN